MPALFVALLLCTATPAASDQLSILSPGVTKTTTKTIVTFNPPPHREYDDGSGARYFICPKDETMLRVPAPKSGATFHCPVDGTEMRSAIGPRRQFFLLDDDR